MALLRAELPLLLYEMAYFVLGLNTDQSENLWGIDKINPNP